MIALDDSQQLAGPIKGIARRGDDVVRLGGGKHHAAGAAGGVEGGGISALRCDGPHVIFMPMNKSVLDQALQLNPTERLELIGELWDSLDQADVPLTPAQIEELDRRLAAYERDPSRGIPLEEFLARLESRHG